VAWVAGGLVPDIVFAPMADLIMAWLANYAGSQKH
jgi:hypothetical protein